MKILQVDERSTNRTKIISLCFLGGSALGLYYAAATPSRVWELAAVNRTEITIVGKGMIILFPVVLTYILMLLDLSTWINFLALVKGFSFVYCIFRVNLLSANWMNILLVQFADLLIMPVVYHFWVNQPKTKSETTHAFFLHLMICFFIFLMDRMIVVPIIDAIFI